jgi:hypothetical protein
LLLLQGAASSLQVIVLVWGGLSCKALLFLRGSFDPCHKDIIDHPCPSLIPTWLQERKAQSKGQQLQNGDRDAKPFPFFS